MVGTALLIHDDNTVTVLEDVKEKELTDKVSPAVSVIFYEEAIDWEYGY